MSESSPVHALDDVFTGGGAMGERMRSIDWSQTPLGPVENWPQSLRTALSICLSSRFPILIWWGPELAMLYNDAYRPMLGVTKHPQAMGQRGQECWPEIWDVIGPMLEGVLTEGKATWSDDQLLLLYRNGYTEECYFTFSYSPIRDETGGVGGVFTAVTETTQRVLGERRLRTLRELAACSTDAHTAEEVCLLSAGALARNPNDLPFALLYLLDKHRPQAHLVGSAGLAPGTPASPLAVELAQQKEAGGQWPLAEVISTGKAVLVANIQKQFGSLTKFLGVEALRSALTLPIAKPGQESLYGVLVVGINPRRVLDEDYRSFFELVAGQIAANVASARAYQEERERAEVLAALDQAKTTFFSNVSHEFRTPLTLLLGPVEDALADEAHPLPAEQRERLQIVRRNGLRLLKLVNMLLDFSRIEAGRVEAIYEPTDLAAFTVELASTFRSAIERAGMQLIVACPPLAEPVYVDHEMWEKIVLNLLSNAFKFTFAGQITIALHQVSDTVELEVRDTGVGIAQEELPRVFERFHRIRDTHARTFEGSGIGLALVQELVRLHGGTIRVASTPSKGTTFTVSLPLGMAHLPAERIRVTHMRTCTMIGATPYVEEALRWLPSSTPPATVPNAERMDTDNVRLEPQLSEATQARAFILLVDDNADMRDYMTRLLSRYYTVEAVTNGSAALKVIEKRIPDLVISDVMMPELDGLQLLEAIRSKPHTSSIPIILLSARAGEEAIVEGIQTGANDYLVKPFSARELLARVHTRLKLSRIYTKNAQLYQQSQKALHARDELFSTVTHDLKNPLGAIKGYAQILQRGLHTTVPEREPIALISSRIDAIVTKMTAQVNELLDLAHLQLGQPLELVCRRVDLVSLTRQVIVEQQAVAQRHQIRLEATVEKLMGEFDVSRLERVIANLLSNAIKYSAKGSTIDVQVTRRDEPERSYAVIVVCDYGMGIPAADLPYIFEPFHRAENVIGKIKGTGVGLSSVYQIVKQHGGTVTVESQEGLGSTFTVLLPIANIMPSSL